MPLTNGQYTALWQDVTVTNAAEFAARVAATDDPGIAASYVLLASPDYWVYRTKVTREELLFSTSVDGTTFDFTGIGWIARVEPARAGELSAFGQLFSTQDETTNPSLPRVRQAFIDIFSGAGIAAANRTHLGAVARRKAKRGEKLFATGTGSSGSPGTMTFEGDITYMDIYYARTGKRP